MSHQQGNLIGLMIREQSIVILDKEPWYSNIHTRNLFKKTKQEKLEYVNLRNQHKRAVRKLGFNPKKTFNPVGIAL